MGRKVSLVQQTVSIDMQSRRSGRIVAISRDRKGITIKCHALNCNLISNHKQIGRVLGRKNGGNGCGHGVVGEGVCLGGRGGSERSQKPTPSTRRSVVSQAVLPGAGEGVMSLLYPYLPSLMGGLTLGVLVVGQLIINGKVLGISGAVKGIVEGDRSPWRVLFVSGLVLGGFIMKMGLYPEAFSMSMASLAVSRMALAGVLVGVGTSLGNGCTSGHGICGNARLSVRSFISTLTFMFFGAIAAAVLSTASLQGVGPGLVTPVPPEPHVYKLAMGVLGTAMAFISTISMAAHRLKVKATQTEADGKLGLLYRDIVEFGTGLFFALGLGVSGMTRPEKVSSFLSVFAGTFDPSLIFVMGGALLVSLPGYQIVLRSQMLHEPLTCDAFSLPTSKQINLQLVIGAMLFGLGWGTAGLCPGPGLVSLASLQAQNFVFVGSMLVGMAATKFVQKMEMQQAA